MTNLAPYTAGIPRCLDAVPGYGNGYSNLVPPWLDPGDIRLAVQLHPLDQSLIVQPQDQFHSLAHEDRLICVKIKTIGTEISGDPGSLLDLQRDLTLESE